MQPKHRRRGNSICVGFIMKYLGLVSVNYLWQLRNLFNLCWCVEQTSKAWHSLPLHRSRQKSRRGRQCQELIFNGLITIFFFNLPKHVCRFSLTLSSCDVWRHSLFLLQQLNNGIYYDDLLLFRTPQPPLATSTYMLICWASDCKVFHFSPYQGMCFQTDQRNWRAWPMAWLVVNCCLCELVMLRPTGKDEAQIRDLVYRWENNLRLSKALMLNQNHIFKMLTVL